MDISRMCLVALLTAHEFETRRLGNQMIVSVESTRTS